MIHGLKPYPAYKDSGVPWLGEVPAHWEVKPLKRWVRINAIVLPDTTPADYEFRYIDIGTVGTGFLIREPQQMRFGGAPSRARRVLRKGDTIISTVRTYLKAVYHVAGDADALVCSTGFAVLTPGPGTQPRYVSYLAQSSSFADCISAESVGTAYPAIAESRLGSFNVPVPPLPEQTAIVRFLDYVDRRIRRYIRAKQKLIKLLEAYRQALIHRAVTGRIDVRTGQPYPAYKDSGVPWLGEVPAHWDVRKLKYVVTFVGGGTPSKANPAFWEGHIPWVSPKDMKTTVITDAEDHISGEAIAASATSIVGPGAVLLVVRSGILRRSIPVAINVVPVALNQDIKALRPKGALLMNTYLRALIQGNQARLIDEWTKQGATVESIEHEYLANSHIPLPPLPEQTAIVEYLNAQTAKIDAAIAATRREIDLLREYRTRLIADVVTGKVDVCEVAAQLPEEPPEEEAELMDTEETAEGEATDGDVAAEALSEEEVEP